MTGRGLHDLGRRRHLHPRRHLHGHLRFRRATSDYLGTSTSEDITVAQAQAVITITSTKPSGVTLNDGTTYTPERHQLVG